MAVGDVLWTPPPEVRRGAEIGRFTEWVAEHRGLKHESYEELWRWSRGWGVGPGCVLAGRSDATLNRGGVRLRTGEVPVKRIVRGESADRLTSRDSLANPEALDVFVELAGSRARVVESRYD